MNNRINITRVVGCLSKKTKLVFQRTSRGDGFVTKVRLPKKLKNVYWRILVDGKVRPWPTDKKPLEYKKGNKIELAVTNISDSSISAITQVAFEER